MLSNAQKKRRIDAILRELSKNPKSKEAVLDLHRLLIEDCEGKLYKYMPIKEYTIPSLLSNTLHISSPTAFNDPFDCKIGIDIQSLVEAIIPFDLLELYVKDYMSVKNGEVILESIPDERKSTISHWLNNRKLTDFFTDVKNKQLSDGEKSTLLLKNFDVICDVVFPWFAEITAQNGIPIKTDMFQKICEILTDDSKKHLVNENGSYNNFIRSLGVVDDTDEIGLTEKAYQLIDPQNTDASHKFKEEFEILEQKLNIEMCSLFKISCLCTDYKNKLMWSHYADSHKGICIEYDFSELSKGDLQPLPVFYSKNRLKVPWKETKRQPAEQQRDLIAHFIKALLTKDEAWKYEREWRILVPAKNGVDDIPAPPIKCIYLGALCSDDNIKQVAEAAGKMNVCLKKMTVDRGEFELHAMPL